MLKNSQHKDDYISLRISKEQKNRWKQLGAKQNLSLTDLIFSSVENKLSNTEKREILKFIEKQVNIFAKIENNINQFAKMANAKKKVENSEIERFNKALEVILSLKEQQNTIFKKIYKLMANDS